MKYQSTLFDEARNKIGSIVASKNRNGNYFRNKVTPHNPRSAAQTRVRGLFTNLTQAWRGLSEAQRAGWVSLAPQITLHDPLGNSYHPTGQQLYISCNSNLTNAGLAVVDDAPATPDAAPDVQVSGLIATIMQAAPHTHVLHLYVGGGAAGQVLMVDATPQFSAGRNFVGRSQYRLLTTDALPVAVPLDILDLYEGTFGSLVLGSKLSVSVKGVTVHGFSSLPARIDSIVDAG